MGVPDRVTLGQVTGVFGVRGWIRVQSYTRPPQGILDYPQWWIRDSVWALAEGRRQGGGLVARLEGLDERDAAAALLGAAIEVERQSLPPAGPGEVYWADLIGCEVVNGAGESLGTVRSLFENAGQDVMVVQGGRERLIPFVAPAIVRQVDVAGRRVVVDWEREY